MKSKLTSLRGQDYFEFPIVDDAPPGAASDAATHVGVVVNDAIVVDCGK